MTLENLAKIAVGEKVRLNAIHGGKLLKRRLMSLGICIGSEFEIVNQRKDGVVLARDGNRVALGAGIIDKLLVEKIK